jgi:hypothetical protein
MKLERIDCPVGSRCRVQDEEPLPRGGQVDAAGEPAVRGLDERDVGMRGAQPGQAAIPDALSTTSASHARGQMGLEA